MAGFAEEQEANAARLLAQLDSVRRHIAAQYPDIEDELASMDGFSTPGTVSAHDGSARRELNPAVASSSPDLDTLRRQGLSPRRKLAPLPPIFQTCHGEALSAGWPQDVDRFVARIVRDEVEAYFDASSRRQMQGLEPGGILKSEANRDVQQEDGGKGKSASPIVGTNEEEKSGGETETDWVFCSENAYGAFIYVGITETVGRAVIRCGPMVLASVLIQAVFSVELALSLNPLNLPEQGPLTCGIPADLQFAAIMVYLCLMLNNVKNMTSATSLSLFSPLYKTMAHDENGEEIGEQEVVVTTRWYMRMFVFLCAVATEVCTWSGILFAGCYWIITAPSVDLVIRSTVSIMFVQNVDEIIYESCCSQEIKEGVQGTRFKMTSWSPFIGTNRAASEKVIVFYGLFVHLPVLATASFTMVYAVRNLDNMDCFPEPITNFGRNFTWS